MRKPLAILVVSCWGWSRLKMCWGMRLCLLILKKIVLSKKRCKIWWRDFQGDFRSTWKLIWNRPKLARRSKQVTWWLVIEIMQCVLVLRSRCVEATMGRDWCRRRSIHWCRLTKSRLITRGCSLPSSSTRLFAIYFLSRMREVIWVLEFTLRRLKIFDISDNSSTSCNHFSFEELLLIPFLLFLFVIGWS